MIEGVKIKELKVHQDVADKSSAGQEMIGEKRGYLMEVVRADEDLLKKFGQTVFTVAYKGMIKAFHWHQKQDDLWFVASGQARIVLYDKRKDSPTYKQTQVIYAGTDNYKLIVIPIGVVHGYQVLGDEPVLMFYHITETYNPNDPDEFRIPYDDPEIGFDWNSPTD